ncbi:MAG: hypothetical protein LBE53_04425 [Paucimonas sp.]|jgi:hypothetical protein|uniref:hypothetical protein n=1 Tax=Pantoea sp. Cy-639 TaxID=2608360 RepID=UPI00141F03B8|nr:hypothetical protein [Pantoea sp. Cy-639]MDR2306427.1 hypothetical protein [Paucimonas sp.]NIF16481.1 hypothetical protein [Pantoea sp. Cy-639]
MNKRVPDSPIPYLSMIEHLTLTQVREHALPLMNAFTGTAEVYLSFDDDVRPAVLLDDLAILAQLLHCLFDHARSLEVRP